MSAAHARQLLNPRVCSEQPLLAPPAQGRTSMRRFRRNKKATSPCLSSRGILTLERLERSRSAEGIAMSGCLATSA